MTAAGQNATIPPSDSIAIRRLLGLNISGVFVEFQIEKIADLARLRLKPEEKAKLEKDLESILGYVKNLDALDTSSVEPTSHVLNLENVYRPDEVKPSAVREDVLRYAPGRDGSFFKVPKVVEK